MTRPERLGTCLEVPPEEALVTLRLAVWLLALLLVLTTVPELGGGFAEPAPGLDTGLSAT